MLKRFNVHEVKSISIPLDPNQKLSKLTTLEEEMTDAAMYQSAIGCLLYAARATCSDIAQAIGTLYQFCSKLNKSHWSAIKRVMRYLRETTDAVLVYTKGMVTRKYVVTVTQILRAV